MRKRLVTALVVCCASLLAALGFSACSNSDVFAGKTYAYESVTVEFADNVSEEIKASYDENLESMKEMYAEMTLSFADGGVFKLDMNNKYAPVQSGKYTADGNNFSLTNSAKRDDGITVISTVAKGELNVDTLMLRQDLSAIAGTVGSGDLKGITIVVTFKEKAIQAAEGDVVAGKTFRYDEMTVVFEGSVTDEEKAAVNERVEKTNSQGKDTVIVFWNDGKYTMTSPDGDTDTDEYTIDGNTVELSMGWSSQEFTLDGDRLTATVEGEGYTCTISYKLK